MPLVPIHHRQRFYLCLAHVYMSASPFFLQTAHALQGRLQLSLRVCDKYACDVIRKGYEADLSSRTILGKFIIGLTLQRNNDILTRLHNSGHCSRSHVTFGQVCHM